MSSQGRVFPDALTVRQHVTGCRIDARNYGGRKMANRLSRLIIGGVGAVTVIVAPAAAQTHELQGIVVTNQNGRLTIKTPHGDQTISVPPHIRVRSISGAFNGNKEIVPLTAVIPGLPVVVEVDNSGGHAVAREIDYKAKDY